MKKREEKYRVNAHHKELNFYTVIPQKGEIVDWKNKNSRGKIKMAEIQIQSWARSGFWKRNCKGRSSKSGAPIFSLNKFFVYSFHISKLLILKVERTWQKNKIQRWVRFGFWKWSYRSRNTTCAARNFLQGKWSGAQRLDQSKVGLLKIFNILNLKFTSNFQVPTS